MGYYDDNSGADYTGDDYSGDDMNGDGDDEVLGAVRSRRAQKPQLSGRPRAPKKLRGYVGMGSVTFNATSGTLLPMVIEPQRGFRPERLVIDRFDGSAVTAPISARVNRITIGDQPQSPSDEQPAPISMFRADATFSGIDFDKATTGMKIRIELSVSAAPAGTELIRLEAGFYGDMLR